MNRPTIEDIYEALAEAVDAVGAPHAEVYLAKVCLALANEVPDPAMVLRVIAACKADLGAARQPGADVGEIS